MVQEFAFGAMEQGAVGLNRLAEAGSSGKHPQNLQRAILAFFGSPAGAPEFSWHLVPMKGGTKPHPFFMPHELFGSLYRHKKALWEQWIRGPEGLEW